MKEEILIPWDIDKVKNDLRIAFENKSEMELLKIIKENSFLLYELYSRKFGIQPAFHEINFGGTRRCDFAWLNDNSDGPEWVIVEIEKPRLTIFKDDNDPTHQFNHAIEQVKSWRRYFNENPAEKKRIFGAVARFRFILVVGDKESWSNEKAAKWRIDHNKETDIEIRTTDIFFRALKILEKNSDELWSFAEHPITLPPSEFENYWKSYSYMDSWRQIIN